MSFFRDFDFTFKGVDFSFAGGKLFIGDDLISFTDFVRFARGEIDLTPKPTIAGTVIALSGSEGLDNDGADFDILREALVATGLDQVLDDAAADFTVFAPTDAAFIELARSLGATVADGDEAAALSAILAALADLGGSEEAALGLLSDILLYHVSPTGRDLATLQEAGTIATAQGGTLSLDGLVLADAEPDLVDPTIVLPDVAASNGTIQVIDRVLLPIDIPGNEVVEDPLPNIVDIATGSDDFQILVKALVAADLVGTVQGLTDITVFAPTDAAFGNLAVGLGFDGDPANEDGVFDFIVSALTDLSGGESPIPLLTNILLFHVSAGAKSATEIDALGTIDTLLTGATFDADGTELVDAEDGLANPEIVLPDIAADNGTIQAIDQVLIPIDIPGIDPDQVIRGTRFSDSLTGAEGNDEINGFAGRDILEGKGGDDHLYGARGRDSLDGGDGDDALFGGWGWDKLVGGAGDDHLTGGRGRDFFIFTGDDIGNDVIKDLSRLDRIVLDEDDFADFEDVEAALSFDGDDAVLSLADGTVTIEHVDEHDINEHLFLFV